MIKRKTGIKTAATVKYGTQSKIIQSEFYKGKPKRYNRRTLQLAEHMSNKMTKTASAPCGSVGASGRGSTMMSSPMFYHPEYEPSSLLLPRDPIEVNAWCRYFYKYDALVSTAIDSHAELPVSTIRLTMPEGESRSNNLKIKERYEEMCSTENLDLFNKLLQIGVEYYKLGNVFPFAQWSEKKKMWRKLTLLDPDYVEIDKLQFTDKVRIDLRPNDRLKEIVSNGPEHAKTGLLFQSIPEDVRELIATGKKIPLNTSPSQGSHVAHVSHKMADYDTLGTSLIERNFKPLVYKDRLRQAQDAVAARHLTPKHLVWAENLSNMDVEAVREQIDNAFADPDYAIITNYELHWELIGTGQSMMQLDSEWNWITEELMIGLMINKSFLLGEGTFANGQTVLEVLNQRYSIYRERLESYIIHYLFLPMAIRNDYAEYEKGTSKKERKIKWIYPKIKWNRLNFVDDTQHKQMLSQMVNQGQIDMKTWLEQFGLDAETIKERLERFEGTPLDVNYFEEQRSIASEVGRALSPAIAKLRAEQRGIEIPEEEDGGGMRFGNSSYKMMKTSNGDNILCKVSKNGKITRKQENIKEAETRDERESDRALKKIKHRKDKINKELTISLEKNVKPPREDMKSPKLFEGSFNSYDDQPLINSDKTEEIKKEIRKEESSKDKWIKKMININMDQNSRRAALALEDSLLSLNGKNDSKNRLKIINSCLPQIFATKIKTSDSITEKTEKVKQRYSEQLSNISYQLESLLEKDVSSKGMKEAIRSTIEKALI